MAKLMDLYGRRPRVEIVPLYSIAKRLESGNYTYEPFDFDEPEADEINEIISASLVGYPLPRIGAKEQLDATQVLSMKLDLFIMIGFLTGKYQLNGLNLNEYSDPGYVESLMVEIFVIEPSSKLYANLI